MFLRINIFLFFILSYFGIIWTIENINDGNLVGDPLVNHWELMNSSEALNYFTAREICHLNSILCTFDDPKDDTPYDIPGIPYELPPATSSLGNSYSYLLRHVSTSPWPKSRYLVDLIYVMIQDKINTLIVAGDSVSEQMFDEMYCSMMREGFDKRLNRGEINLDNTLYKYIDFTHVNGSYDKYTPYFRILYIRMNDEVKAHAIRLYQRSLYNSSENLVFIFNIGLHMNNKNQYQVQMKRLYHEMQHLRNQGHIVMFRETSAQHFNTTSGGFIGFESYPFRSTNLVSWVSLLASNLNLVENPVVDDTFIYDPISVPNDIWYTCVPIKSLSSARIQNWRNEYAFELMKEAIDNLNVGYLYFFNITVARWDYHRGVYGDCTHYVQCANMLWKPIWDQAYEYYTKRVSQRSN